MVGGTLGHYRIEAKLGEGGTGIVYRATDTRLDRTVAVKILNPDRLADPELRARVLEEAKAASAIHHPNIVTIYEIHSHRGADFIAMEYVGGRTLRRLLSRRLRTSDVLKYAVQLAEGLARAHAAGMVHRHLRPGHVMVTADGVVKILGLGLAKLADTTGVDAALELRFPTARPQKEDIAAVAYLSPEQAEGREVDERTDIFAFGSVLYEMASGRPAFQGPSRIAILWAISHQEPEPLAASDVPYDLRKIIALCLRKDPERRFQHMADVRVALQDISSEAPRTAPAGRQRLFPGGAMLAGAALAAAAATATWWAARPPSRPEIRLEQVTFDPGLSTEPALSRDGGILAYASDRAGDGNLDVWVQRLATGQTVRLTAHPADDHEPAFSPDASRLAFRSERDEGGVYIISTLGGGERLLASHGRRPRFSPDGATIAFWTGNSGADPTAPDTSKIYIVPSAGGPPRHFQEGFAAARYPVWSPDGKLIVFWGIRDGVEDWWAAPAAGGAAIRTGALEAIHRKGLGRVPGHAQVIPAEWSSARRLLFCAQIGDAVNLWTLPIDPKTARAAGEPERLTTGGSLEVQPAAVSAGLVAFASRRDQFELWRLRVDHGRVRAAAPLERLTTSVARDLAPMVAGNGSRVVFASKRSGAPEVWIKELATGRETPVALSSETAVWPVISPDGSRVAYRGQNGEKPAIYVVPAGGGVSEKICDNCRAAWSFSPNSRHLLLWPLDRSVAVLDLRARTRAKILERSGYAILRARFSPDGRWIAFRACGEPGRSNIYVAPFRDLNPISEQDWIPVTEGESHDMSAAWSADGEVIYFLSERDGFRCIWARRVQGASKQPYGPLVPVQHFHAAARSMMPADPDWLNLSASRDALVFNLADVSGNIWLAREAAR
jgi:Tol biopolymer transport system component/tRNA A-37 threonylcarbamoyl transferase component Bud32